MTTQVYEKMKREIKQELWEEFVFPILQEVKDVEGDYKKEFVKEIFKAMEEKPLYQYNSKTFLKQIS